jgi:8-oxo-dGTP pyrophosphatase MutT (NUDIX family)
VFFQPKSVQQVAALPFVCLDASVEVLLVTSRRRGRWIVPKGWPTKRHSLAGCAALEAEEEAGVVGLTRRTPIGNYDYVKQMPLGYGVRCEVFVYPLLVLEHRLTWRERSERKLRWAPLADAADMVDDRKLAGLMMRLAADGGSALREFFDAAGDGFAVGSALTQPA